MCCFREIVQREAESDEALLFYSWHGEFFVGFPRVDKVKHGFARCQLCRLDLTIETRGATALHDSWRGEGHQLPEIRYWLQKGWRLYNLAWEEISAAGWDHLVASMEVLPVVSLEPMFAVSIEMK